MTVARTDGLVQQTRQLRIGIAQPTTVGDTVGHVAESLGIHGVEVLEDRLGQNLGVKLGYTVGGMRANYAQICHTNLTVADDAHLGNAIPVSGERLPCVTTEALVDLLDDHMDSGQLQAEEILVPRLKRLGHDGMVGVRADLNHGVPRSVPIKEILVDQDSHQLGNTKGGMGIVDVDRHLIRQIVQRAVYCHMVADNALTGSGNHKILLRQTEQLSFDVIIRRIQHLGDQLRVGAFLHGAGILSLRKQTHIEIVNISGFPQPKLCDRLTVRTRDHHVVGYCFDLLAVLIKDLQMSVLPVLLHVTAHLYVINAVGSGNQPDLSAGQPDIGKLYLHTVYDHLLEQTVLIADGKARGGIIQ